jgi:glycosyltransferase involved in cell wall biosynthesis
MLLDAHEQLLRRDVQLHTVITGLPPVMPEDQPEVLRIRQAVQHCVPVDSSLLVISKGDDALLDHPGRQAWHFPQDDTGAFPWHYPADSAEAIAHLDLVQSRSGGFDFLLIPQTSFWWLSHYTDFARQLEASYRVVWRDHSCLIFKLESRPEPVAAQPQPRQARIKSLPFGVNIAGNFRSEKGTGEAVRSNVKALLSAGIPVALNDVPDESSTKNSESIGHPFRQDNPYAINLIHLTPDSVLGFLDDQGEAYLRGRYNIGFWVWELSDFPAKWAGIFNFFDEIWVPSDFVLDAISRISPIPVVKIPHAVPEESNVTKVDPQRFGIPPGVFCFFFMFDFHSFVERKNPQALIEAFRLAFGDRTDVQLLLKCSRSTPDDLAMLRQLAGGSNVKVFDEILTRPELSALLQRCDCYVSLHRSEGFGLTLAEAMSMGKPVIATGYSGNMEFMTLANSFPVRCELIPLETDHGDYAKGSVWAQADVEHAAELMRVVQRRRSDVGKVALRGQKDVRERFSIAAIGRLMKRRLDVIASTAGIGIDEQTAALREAAGVIPRHARVLVAAGGDDRWCNWPGGQRAIHFPHRANFSACDVEAFNPPQLIAHLEMARRMGAEYLVIPPTSLALLETKTDFVRYLDQKCQTIPVTRASGPCWPLPNEKAFDDRAHLARAGGPCHGDAFRIYRLAPQGDPEAIRQLPVNLTPIASWGVRAEARQWICDGADRNVVFGLGEPRFVSAIQIDYRFARTDADSPPAVSRIFWKDGEANDFDEQRCATLKQRNTNGPETRLVIVNDTIDQIRFDPDLRPAVLDRLAISIFVPADDEQGVA